MTDSSNPFAGTDLYRLVRGQIMLGRLRNHIGDVPVEWILPPHILPGVTAAWGIPIRRAEGLTAPYLGLRIDEPDDFSADEP